MMRALILLHRVLGVLFCLFFAMWFASGIVMHFVPFPALTEAERFAGLAPIDLARVVHGPAEAVGASRIADATSVRLLGRSDGPVYLVSARLAVKALRATDLADGAVTSEVALAIAMDYARLRQLAAADAHVVTLTSYDQWTVSGGFDHHRPLYRIALHDNQGTELYVSSTTGEVVLDTTRQERLLNYVGSVAHWIYPTKLRSHPAAWSRLVWWLSLLALIGATTGAVVGTLRIEIKGTRLSPYSGWLAWHQRLGLVCMLFVLTWIFSGWLSMDDGRLFSTGKPTEAEAKAFGGMPDWQAIPRDELQRVSRQAKEIEWFALGGQMHRRERLDVDQQRLFSVFADVGTATIDREFLEPGEINAAGTHLAAACNVPVAIEADDDYPLASAVPNAPVFRLVCGSDWFHIDGASGALLEKLDRSRRIYRWLYSAVHTLDFHALTIRPMLRTSLIVTLCGFGLIFSFTGVVIALRRLSFCLRFADDERGAV